MMAFLIPLGFLGLISIAALILIWVIKPNYQVKHIASTYVWQLSLRYRRKKLPSSPIRNVLLFLCQLLILTAMAFILAGPIWRSDSFTDTNEIVAVIDSSASMYAQTDGKTRFERAVDEVIKLTNSTAAKGGTMSVIIADEKPYFLAERIAAREAASVVFALQDLVAEEGCSYGSANIDAAMELCADVLEDNSSAGILLYTDTSYTTPTQNVEVVSVNDDEEWNAGILNAYAELEDEYYVLTVELASYRKPMESGGKTDSVNLSVEVKQSDLPTVTFNQPVFLESGATKKVIFRYGGGEEDENTLYYGSMSNGKSEGLTDTERFSSFEYIYVSIDTEGDSIPDDNSFYVYGGQKEIIRVQYASTDPNPFFPTSLNIIRRDFADRWDIRLTETPAVENPTQYETSGFDFYIFEHMDISSLPRDGAVLLADPRGAPVGSELSAMRTNRYTQGMSCSSHAAHPILQGINPDNILMWSTTDFTYPESMYTSLLDCNSTPVLLCSNRRDLPLAVMSFSVNLSNIVRTAEWHILLNNLFEYFFPSTVEKYAYEVDEPIKINARGPAVTVKEDDIVLEEFPATLSFSGRRTVTLTQESYFKTYGKNYPDIGIYITTPAVECDIWHVEERLDEPQVEEKGDHYKDLIVWFAAAIMALLFAEWWLHSRDNR